MTAGRDTVSGKAGVVPDYTILMAARDRLPILRESVASALRQEYPAFELLVVDDGSGPETKAWLDEEALRDDRVRVIHQSHLGVARARQNGLAAARACLICILDSDDLLLPGALQRMKALFDAQPETDLAYINNIHRLPDGNTYTSHYPRFTNNRAMIHATLLRPRVPFKHSGTTFRRDVALQLGGYDTTLPLKIDVDLFLRFLARGRRLVLLEEPGVEFRMHRDSVSRRRLNGIGVWWLLVDRYGPVSPVARLGYKIVRTVSELLKLLYLLIRL
jgi:glycosyltransferase involved in cell wall biosynthesis